MSNPGDADATPITSARQLADHIAAGCKPRSQFRIGTEHEKFGFGVGDFLPPPYQPAGIRAVLERMQGDGWTPILDAGNPIGLQRGRASVSLEPAGQLELSGGTLATLHETRAELDDHLARVREAAEPLGLGFAPLGFHPTMRRDQMPWMPKGRYAIMRRYMPRVGSLGLDMMTRTCTVQVNLDYESEADMLRKLRVSLALQPLATALFANSPFTEGRPNGFLSYRAQVWTDTDNQRRACRRRSSPTISASSAMSNGCWTCRCTSSPAMAAISTWPAGRFATSSPGGCRIPGRATATVGDFADHMTTAFTDVRIKRFLEMRGSDAGSPDMMLAQSAFWVGLLYDPAALEAAYALVRRRPWADYAALRAQVPRLGLQAPWAGGGLRALAREVVGLAQDGLRARACRGAAADGAGLDDERPYLEPLAAIAAGAPTQAEIWLQRFNGPWRGDVTRIFNESAR